MQAEFPIPFIATMDQQLSGWPWTEETDPMIYSSQINWPKISIITPSYNQGQFLEQTIRSVLLQHYPNLEYIIIDGGSTDQSVTIIRKYSQWIHYWISEEDDGQSDALNKGCRLASGEIITWLNSDDYYEKNTLFKVAMYYLKPGFSFFCGACRMIDQQGKFIQHLFTREISYASLLKYWKPHFCPPQPSMFFKRAVLRELGDFNTDLKYTMDFDLWLKASKKYSFLVITDNLSCYRIHNNSKTGSAGGLRKFVPEWKMLIRKSLKQEPVMVKLKYYIHEKLSVALNSVRRFFNRQQMKNNVRQWMFKIKM
jgi:glycosyltransferase involved in cell wall biosynthesis